jgi:hypothetical protein
VTANGLVDFVEDRPCLILHVSDFLSLE